MLHKTLDHQLKKYFGTAENPPREWQGFLEAVSETYTHYDNDHILTERSLEISSREHTEYIEKLRSNEQHFRTLVDNLPDVVARVDKDLKLIFLNQQIRQTTGHDPEELVKMSANVLPFPPEILELYKKMLLEVLETKKMVTFESTQTGKHGQEIIESRLIPELASDNTVDSILIISRDITKRKTVESLIESQKNFLNNIIDSIADPLFVKNEKHEWILMNEAFSKMLGKTKEELLNKSDYDFLPKDQADIFWNKDAEVLDSGIENTNEETITDGTGKIRTLFTKKTRFVDKNNNKFIVGLILDITQRKQTENILKENQEKLKIYELAINESPVSVVITDPQGAIEYVNTKFCTLTGYSAEEIKGTNPRILKSGETSAETYATLWKTVTAGNVWEGEFVNKKKNGETYWEYATISPLLNAEGKITHFIAVKEDITARKQAEKIDHERRKELERMNQIMIGRELKMVELKTELARLTKQLSEKQS